jgi:hypothetical protein
MAKIKEKEEAIRLRKLGKSYKEIRSIIPVSKGSLSLWLRDHPLSHKKLRELRDWNMGRIEHYQETRKKQREAKLVEIYKNQKGEILPLSHRELLIAGLFLYWGEGGKSILSTQLAFSNTDPAMIKFFINWLEEIFGFKREKIKIRMHFYKDMDVKKETDYWAKTLKISKGQFKKPYIKDSKFSSLSYKRGFGHGTCNVLVYDAMLGKKMMMSLKVVSDFFMGQ